MPQITVNMMEGRPVEVKRDVVKKLTDALVDALKCPPEAVSVHIVDLPKDSFSRGGGILEIDKK